MASLFSRRLLSWRRVKPLWVPGRAGKSQVLRASSIFTTILGLSLTPSNSLKVAGLAAITSGVALSCGLIEHFNKCLGANAAAFITAPGDGII
jgi:hypothetical protein